MNIRQELAKWKIGRFELSVGSFVIGVMIFVVVMPTLMNSERRAYEAKSSLITQRLNASGCWLKAIIPKEKTCKEYPIPTYNCIYASGGTEYAYYYDSNEDKVYPISYDNYSMLKGECNKLEVI